VKKGAHLKKLAVSTIVVLIVLFGLTVAAKATLITYELGGVFSAASPTSPAPWLTASFNDNGGGTTSGFVGTVPIPPAVWLLGSGLLGLIGIRRRLVGIANGKRKMKGDKCNGIRQ